MLAHPDGFGYRIDYLCAGIQPAALMAATLLLLRAAWTQRAIGILVALVGVELFNIARLVHLYLLGVHWPEGFDVPAKFYGLSRRWLRVLSTWVSGYFLQTAAYRVIWTLIATLDRRASY